MGLRVKAKVECHREDECSEVSFADEFHIKSGGSEDEGELAPCGHGETDGPKGGLGQDFKDEINKEEQLQRSNRGTGREARGGGSTERGRMRAR